MAPAALLLLLLLCCCHAARQCSLKLSGSSNGHVSLLWWGRQVCAAHVGEVAVRPRVWLLVGTRVLLLLLLLLVAVGVLLLVVCRCWCCFPGWRWRWGWRWGRVLSCCSLFGSKPSPAAALKAWGNVVIVIIHVWVCTIHAGPV